MSFLRTILATVVVAAIVGSAAVNAFTKCRKSDPNRDSCLLALAQDIVPQLRNGLPQYNLGSIDPFYYPSGLFRYNQDGVSGGLLVKDVEIVGLSGAQVLSISTNFTGNRFLIRASSSAPKLRATGQFKADAKLGSLQVQPKGPFEITLTNVKSNGLASGSIETNADGSKRLRLKRFNANVSVGGANIVANGVLSDENLNKMILNLINQNLPQFIRQGVPTTRSQWEPIVVDQVNKYLENVPVEKFFTD